MPGELRNFVALAIASGTSKGKNHMPKAKTPPMRRRATKELKDQHNGVGTGAKRLAKFLSKSYHHSGGNASTIGGGCDENKNRHVLEKRAPVASPESDGTSLLNSGSENGHLLTSSYGDASKKNSKKIMDRKNEKVDEKNIALISEDEDEDDACETSQIINNSLLTNGYESSDDALLLSRGRNREDYSLTNGSQTDDEDQRRHFLSEKLQCDFQGEKQEKNSKKENYLKSEKSRGWYATRKSYRSVAYKTWTVGAARSMLNGSRSDYDLPPAAHTSELPTDAAAKKSVTVSDSEEKYFHRCSRSQDDDLELNLNLIETEKINFVQNLEKAKNKTANKPEAESTIYNTTVSESLGGATSGCARSATTTSERSTNLLSSTEENSLQFYADISTKNGLLEENKNYFDEFSPGTSSSLNEDIENYRRKRGKPNDVRVSPAGASPKNSQQKSWLLIATSWTDDNYLENIDSSAGPSTNGNEFSASEKNNNMSSPSTRKKLSSATTSRSAGDCFSSEDYFKFTLRKRLLQERQEQQNKLEFLKEFTPPQLLALDRDIRTILNNLNDESTAAQKRQRHPADATLATSNAPQQNTSSPIARENSFVDERKNGEKSSGGGHSGANLENHKQSWPSSLSCSSASSSSSSSSSMSWLSNRKQVKKYTKNPDALPHSKTVQNGDFGGKTTPTLRARSKTTTTPFRNNDDAVNFLKQELESIRKKDFQILKQLYRLDAEISRRKSETDALSSYVRASPEPVQLDRGDIEINGRPNRGKIGSNAVLPQNVSKDKPTFGGFLYATSGRPLVPPLPKCLEVNFKTF